MAAGCFEVDTDILQRDTNTLRQHLQAISLAHTELCDKMTEVASMWEGPAKEAFHLQFKNDCTQLAEVIKQIREVLDSMDVAVKEYNSCDDRVKGIIDAIQI